MFCVRLCAESAVDGTEGNDAYHSNDYNYCALIKTYEREEVDG